MAITYDYLRFSFSPSFFLNLLLLVSLSREKMILLLFCTSFNSVYALKPEFVDAVGTLRKKIWHSKAETIQPCQFIYNCSKILQLNVRT